MFVKFLAIFLVVTSVSSGEDLAAQRTVQKVEGSEPDRLSPVKDRSALPALPIENQVMGVGRLEGSPERDAGGSARLRFLLDSPMVPGTELWMVGLDTSRSGWVDLDEKFRVTPSGWEAQGWVSAEVAPEKPGAAAPTFALLAIRLSGAPRTKKDPMKEQERREIDSAVRNLLNRTKSGN